MAETPGDHAVKAGHVPLQISELIRLSKGPSQTALGAEQQFGLDTHLGVAVGRLDEHARVPTIERHHLRHSAQFHAPRRLSDNGVVVQPAWSEEFLQLRNSVGLALTTA